MPTYSIRKKIPQGTARDEGVFSSLIFAFVLATILLKANGASAQIYLPQPPPPASQYGQVILNNHASTGPGPVVFDHWLHRSKFTCRLCHVDIGFAMQANATGVSATTNAQGFHCGACHNGTTAFDGKPTFAACSNRPESAQCDRCHSLGKKGVRQYEYETYSAKFPKSIYGIDWEGAEKSHQIQPVDFVDGISVKKPAMKPRGNFGVQPQYSWVHPIQFSHEKHIVWNGCELCHPEIFPAAEKGTAQYSMLANVEGRYCGSCHGKVAFPLNNCQRCHPRAPLWEP